MDIEYLTIGGVRYYCYYYESKELFREEWWFKGRRHKDDGPAYIEYNKDGSVNWMYWCVNGFPVDDDIITTWLIENNLHYPYSDEDRLAIKLFIS